MEPPVLRRRILASYAPLRAANFRVGISLDADAEEIKARIRELDGVRHVSGLWEE